MFQLIITETTSGGNCTGTDGQANRVLTIGNTSTTNGSIFLVMVGGLALRTGSEFTASHLSSSSTITFLNNLYNDQSIIVEYR